MPAHIYLVIPYYGKFKNYFQLYLNSLSVNSDILTVLLITDNDMSNYAVPDNCIVIKKDLEEIRKGLYEFLTEYYPGTPVEQSLIQSVYKFCDLRPIYPILFEDSLKAVGLKPNDYVGFGDVDLIYGKLSNIINLENNYSGFGLNGHFFALRNTEEFKQSYSHIENYEIILTQKGNNIDEAQFIPYHKKYALEKNLNHFDLRPHIADILPYTFIPHHYKHNIRLPLSWEQTFRELADVSPENWQTLETTEKHKHRLGTLIDELYLISFEQKDIRNRKIAHIECDEAVRVFLENGSDSEVAYIHLLRRPMDVSEITQADKKFYIQGNKFIKKLQ